MSIAQSFLGEFDNEMANTRKVLERVPEEKVDFTPHDKSPTLGWLAAHVTNLPTWAALGINADSFDLKPAGQEPPRAPVFTKRDELLEKFDRNVSAAREAIAGASDETFMQPWTLMREGQKLFTIPKVGVIRTWMMNHLIHHRAQLTVYLRLNDVPVPSLYGPTADEQP
jgi:uncharacterized damage-inducible protein DinB